MNKADVYCLFLRMVAKETIDPLINPPPRTARVLLDYELFFVCSGSGTTVMNGQRYVLRPGYLYLVPPGTTHYHEFDSRFEFYYLHMDIFYSVHRDLSFVVPWSAKLQEKDRIYMQPVLQHSLPDGEPIPYGILVSSSEQCIEQFEKLLTLYNEAPAFWRLRSQGMLSHLIEPFLNTEAQGSDASLEQRLHRAILYMRGNIHQRLSLEAIANAAHLSVFYFSRQFKHHYSMTPAHYHMQLRLETAAARLLQSLDSVQHIADELGFKSPFHFSRCFKERYKQSPRAFRDRLEK